MLRKHAFGFGPLTLVCIFVPSSNVYRSVTNIYGYIFHLKGLLFGPFSVHSILFPFQSLNIYLNIRILRYL